MRFPGLDCGKRESSCLRIVDTACCASPLNSAITRCMSRVLLNIGILTRRGKSPHFIINDVNQIQYKCYDAKSLSRVKIYAFDENGKILGCQNATTILHLRDFVRFSLKSAHIICFFQGIMATVTSRDALDPSFGEGPEESHNEDKEGGVESWLTVAGSALVYFASYGFNNSFGFFQNYYQLHLLSHYAPSKIAFIGTLQITLMYIMGPLAGALFDALGLKVQFM